jgi:hypothetical protein
VTANVVTGGLPLITRAVCATVPTYGVTVYREIARPPLAGAVQETVAEAFPAFAVTPVGESGTVAGVTAVDADDAVLVPAAFVALTRNVYAVPLVNPVTASVVAGGVPVTV